MKLKTLLLVGMGLIAGWRMPGTTVVAAEQRPNIFIAISDDVSWPHKSAYGSKMVDSPAFDRVARNGILFNQAFCAAPGCSPSRAALLTGRNIWQIEHAGTHASYFSPKYDVYPDRLEQAGYFVGSTGKAWGPGDWKTLGRERNPAGPAFGDRKSGYVGGFTKFLKQRPKDRPFCFWFGSTDAHRGYKKGSGQAAGKQLSQAEVPAFLPDTPEVRDDLLDYAFEIERFDTDAGRMLDLMEEQGLLENTLVIVTSDNGMPFPRAKANCYEFGIHMPLAIQWPARVPGGRTSDDLVSFIDLTATIYEASRVAPPVDNPIAGRGLLQMLTSEKSGMIDPTRDAVFAGRERHSSSRYRSLSYPQRAIRTHDLLYIRNFASDRWPAGPGQKYDKATWSDSGEQTVAQLSDPHAGYHDIDACPTLDFLIAQRDDRQLGRFLKLAVDKRPAEELFDIRNDPGCLNNLAGDVRYVAAKHQVRTRLMDYLKATQDDRVGGTGDVWETYPRVSGLRWFPEPDWARHHPQRVPQQDWLEKRRPRAK